MSTSQGSEYLMAEPDADSIKLFVGQIPRQWNEEDAKKFLEEFGPVHSLNVLRDRSTNVSKGCCFVTFFHRNDALNAQNTLHNVRVLPGMHHAMQIKPADSENQRKLFIGMLSKSASEDDVRAIFQEFGQIEDCVILRDFEGNSRGCAFLTFVTRNCAQLAIRQMHEAKTFEGCTKPVVVKFADTPKDKEKKKTSSLTAALGGTSTLAAALSGNSALSRLLAPQQPAAAAAVNPAVALLTQLLQPQQQQQQQTNDLLSSLQALLPLVNSAVSQQNQLQQQQQQQRASSSSSSSQLSELLQQQKLMALLNSTGRTTSSSSVSPSRYNPEPDYLQEFQQQQHRQQRSPSPQQQQQQLPSTLLAQLQAFAQMNGGGGGGGGLPGVSSGGGGGGNSLTSALQAMLGGGGAAGGGSDYLQAAAGGNGQSKGPEGCNLFIYHLPQDFADNELSALFALFGTVLSAKVFVDPRTKMSKCFGFVSYDNAESAQKAIKAMNGFQIGAKRLKVQVKRSNDKPYERPAGANGGGAGGGGANSPLANFLSGQKYGADD